MGIDDLDELVIAIIDRVPDRELSKERFRLTKSTTNDMLDWHNPPEIQPLPMKPFYRVGIVGDGNCMLHTILFAMSPTYRRMRHTTQSTVTHQFRKILNRRADYLRVIATEIYPEVGGADFIEEGLEILEQDYEELGIEMGPVICRMYGCNFLAVSLDDDLAIDPVVQTYTGGTFDPSLLTVLVHFMGGSTNMGRRNGFRLSGHYEVIIGAEPFGLCITDTDESNDSNISGSEDKNVTVRGKVHKIHTTRKAKHRKRAGLRLAMNPDHVKTFFSEGDEHLVPLIAQFTAVIEGYEQEPEALLERAVREREGLGEAASSSSKSSSSTGLVSTSGSNMSSGSSLNSNLARAIAASLGQQTKQEEESPPATMEGGRRRNRRTKKRRHYKH